MLRALILSEGRKHTDDGFFANFTWDHGATIVAALVAALVAAAVAVVGYRRQQQQHRRDRRAIMFAEALRAVEDYLEVPYRVRRRDGSHQARMAVTDHISDIQSRISFHTGWLDIHASPQVRDAYTRYVAAAKQEAGPQVTAAWKARPTRRDRDVPIGEPLRQPNAAAARKAVLAAMRANL